MAARAAADLTLYDSPGSPCARRVRITLAEKGLPWRTQDIDLSRLEQRSPRYLAVNPNGLVPALAHGDRLVWESSVITEYLDRIFPERPLYPADAADRFRVKSWQAAELSMAKTFRPLMYQRLMGPVVHASRTHAQALDIARRSTEHPADLDWEDRVWRVAVLDQGQQDVAEQGLLAFADEVETALHPTGWLVGDGFSQAEISIFPRLAMYPLVGLALPPGRYPRTLAWLKHLSGRPSFVRTQSPAERRIHAFARSSAFRFLRRVAAKPVAERGRVEAAGLAALGMAIGWVQRPKAARGAFLTPGSTPPPVQAAAARTPPTLQAGPGFGLRAWPGAADGLIVRAALAWRQLPDTQPVPGPFALLHDGGPVADVAAALDLVDLLAAPGPRLFPDDPWAETQIRLWLAFDASLHKETRALETAARGSPPPPGAQSPELCRAVIGERLDQLDHHLAARSWLVGCGASFADTALAVRMATLDGLAVRVSDGRAALAAWRGRAAQPH